MSVKFKTGGAPEVIPLENILYSYPVIAMQNLYPDESDEGVIKLKKGQAYLFEELGDWSYSGQFVSSKLGH